MSEQTSAASPRTERTVGRFFVCGGLKSPDELLSPFQGLQTARLHHYRLRIIIGGGAQRLPRIYYRPFRAWVVAALRHCEERSSPVI